MHSLSTIVQKQYIIMFGQLYIIVYRYCYIWHNQCTHMCTCATIPSGSRNKCIRRCIYHIIMIARACSNIVSTITPVRIQVHAWTHNTALHSALDMHVLHKVNVAMEFGVDTHVKSFQVCLGTIIHFRREGFGAVEEVHKWRRMKRRGALRRTSNHSQLCWRLPRKLPVCACMWLTLSNKALSFSALVHFFTIQLAQLIPSVSLIIVHVCTCANVNM